MRPDTAPWRSRLCVGLSLYYAKLNKFWDDVLKYRVEVIHNGKVVRALPSVRGQIQIPVTDPGWLAVRCIESVTDTVRYAHTSPFYFPVKGRQPVVKSEAARWSQTIGRIAAEVSPKDYPDQTSYEKAQSMFRQAQVIYDRL